MSSKTRWLMVPLTIIALFLMVWDFTPRASMKSAAKSDQGETNTPDVTPNVSYRSPSDRHKVQVSDAALAQEIASQGGRVIGDYGTYRIFEVNSALAGTLAANRNIAIRDEDNLVLLNAGAIDTTRPEIQASRSGLGSFSGKRLHLIQFAGPIKPEWYDALLKTGAQVVTYIPNNAYLVYGTAKNLQGVQGLAANSAVGQWDGAYTSQYRLDPAIAAVQTGKEKAESKTKVNPDALSASGNELFALQLVADEAENAKTLALIERLKLEPVIKQESALGYLNVVVALPVDGVAGELADRTDVVSIQRYTMPKKMDERQDQIVAGNLTAGGAPIPGNYLTYLTGKGFNVNTTASFGVNVSDSGIDNGTQTPNHFGLYRQGDPTSAANSRVVYNRLEGTPNTGSTIQGCDGHGNLNTHIIGGYVPTGTVNGVNFAAAPHADAAGYRYGLGVAPFVKFGSSVIFDPATFTSPNYFNLEARAYNDGMRVSSNSWGANNSSYTIDSQQYDALVRDAQQATSVFPTAGNQEYVIVFAAGNAGAGAGTVGEPSTAKNVITVGAAENVQAFGAADGCSVADTGADNANDIIGFSSRGPTSDGRIKPDIVAPGTHVSGGVAQASLVLPAGSGTGAQLACFDGSGVCGGTANSNFFPTGQQYYTASSGTSHSTPAIAGVAALMRQHFINQSLPVPSPALTKGMMMNAARYLTGTGANDSLPSNNQGMGEASLNNYFDIFSTPHIFRDQVAADTLTASGQQRVTTGNVSDSTKPFRVTLAWTDTPGPTSGNAFVNNLDLEVTINGNTYRGNVFSGATSATGGTADSRNNVESVFIPAGVTGNFVVRVRGTNIAGDGVPNTGGALDQDYALVVYNGVAAALPVPAANGATITNESCSPGNGAIDPGETVTVNLALINVGTAPTTNLTATLVASSGVTSPSGPQNYGALPADGTTSVARPFTFTAGTTCGQVLTVTLQLNDGASNLGTVTYNFQTGALGANTTATYTSGNLATAIPDVSSVNIPIVVTDTGAVSDVNVRVRLNHTFDGDVVMSLISPDGTTINLATNRGGSGQNYGTGANDCSGTPTVFDDAAATSITAGAAPFAGTFRPEGLLSGFNGKSVNGTWMLRVSDTASLDTGTVGCVTLEITRQRYVCCGISGAPQIVTGGAATITAESVTPANNRPDPGETVTATFPVLNSGDANTTNLVGTLLTSGGVTPVGNPSRTYGVVVAAGAASSQPFTFSASGACGSTITATIHFQDGALDLGNISYTFQLGTVNTVTQTYSNTATITVPGTGTGASTGAPASPYPSNIAVAGFTSPVTNVKVTLTNLNHTFPDDVDMLLVGPTGATFVLLSDIGGGNDWVNTTYTLDDNASANLSDSSANPSGTYKPTNFGTGDAFPAPAPAGPYNNPASAGTATFASTFNGLNPNGTWSLYVSDDATGDSGNIMGGWSLTLESSSTVCNTQACSVTCPANITVPAGAGSTGANVNYPAPSVTGTCNTVTSSPASGTFFPVGTTTVNVSTGAGPACSFTVTVTPPPVQSGNVLISEFRLRGSNGANDEFVELYNNTNAPITVNTTGGSTGWALVSSDNLTTPKFVVLNGTVIPARGHFLGVNSVGYSLATYPAGNGTTASGDVTYTTDIPDNSGLALFNTTTAANFVAANSLDAVGFTSVSNTLFKEGAGIPALTPFSIDHSLVRNLISGLPRDTGDNAADFLFVDTNGTSAGAGQRLGAPGPENLSSPIQRNTTIKTSLIDPACSDFGAVTSGCAKVRVGTSDPANNSTFGTLEIRRKFTNNTGANVTRLRFRVVDISTFPAPSGTADLRSRTSGDVTVTVTGGGTMVVRGTTLEQPASQPNGGGFNSSMSAGAITLGAPIAPGASVNVRFLLGVQQNGNYRFIINLEALTAAAGPIADPAAKGRGDAGQKLKQ